MRDLIRKGAHAGALRRKGRGAFLSDLRTGLYGENYFIPDNTVRDLIRKEAYAEALRRKGRGAFLQKNICHRWVALRFLRVPCVSGGCA